MLLPRKICRSVVFKEVVVWLILALCGLSKCNLQIGSTASTMLTSQSKMLTSPSTMDVHVQDEIRGYLKVSALESVISGIFLRSIYSHVINRTALTFLCLRSRNINNEIDRSCLETTLKAQEVSYLCKWTTRDRLTSFVMRLYFRHLQRRWKVGAEAPYIVSAPP